MKNRAKEIGIGMSMVAIFFLLIFSSDKTLDSPTGMVVQNVEQAEKYYFTAFIDGREHYFYFSGKWYQAADGQQWEVREDMGDTIWSGLYYLRSYGAKIYYHTKEITDITQFAREWNG